MAVSHSDYHKHGAYILVFTDAPGFAVPELHYLGLLVFGHRGKLKKLEADFDDELFVHQLFCLRLAVILRHARRDPDAGGLQLSANGRKVTLKLPSAWMKNYPQSGYLLKQEAESWQKMPWTFAVA